MKRALAALFVCLLGAVHAAQQPVNVGSAPNDGTGDPVRAGFVKLNANDTELYALVGAAVPSVLASSYGLICDGTTDNAAAITAINTAISGLSNGGSVFFAPQAAACLTSVALVPRSNVTIYAEPNTVILQPTVTSTASPLLLSISGGGKSNILVYGLTFDGGGADFGSANAVIQIGGVSNAVLDTVTVQNTRGRAAFFGGNVTYSGVRNSVFKNVGNHWKTTLDKADRYPAVLFQTVATNVSNFLRGNYFEDIGLDAMAVINQTNFNASNNTCYIYNNQYGLITSPDFPNCIYFATNNGGSITGNVIAGPNGNGIGLVGSRNVTVSGNFVRDAGGAGITVPDTDVGITVSGNTLVDNNQYASTVFSGGIVLTGTTSKVTISGNTAYDDQTPKTQQYGLDYSTYAGTVVANDLQLSGNNFAGNLTGAIGGTNTGTISTSDPIIFYEPITVSLGTSLSQATWGNLGLGFIISTATMNDTSTGSATIGADAAYAIQAPTITNTQGTANTLTAATTLNIFAPVCGAGWSSCTNLYGLTTGGRIGGFAGITITGATANLNLSSNFATNINTGTNNSTLTLGGTTAGNVVNLNTVGYRIGNVLYSSVTAPTIASGFNTASYSITAASTASFSVTVGTSTGTTTGVLTMPTASHGWACSANDVTTPATHMIQQTGSGTTSVTVTDYVRTTGIAQNMANSDVIEFLCGAN